MVDNAIPWLKKSLALELAKALRSSKQPMFATPESITAAIDWAESALPASYHLTVITAMGMAVNCTLEQISRSLEAGPHSEGESNADGG